MTLKGAENGTSITNLTVTSGSIAVEAITFTADFKKSIRESWGWFDIVGTLVVIGLCAAFYAYFW